MYIKSYDPTDDHAWLNAEGYSPKQIHVILSVRRRLWNIDARWRAQMSEANAEARGRDEGEQQQPRACPFLNLVDALRTTLN